jgi:hypothetical protein
MSHRTGSQHGSGRLRSRLRSHSGDGYPGDQHVDIDDVSPARALGREKPHRRRRNSSFSHHHASSGWWARPALAALKTLVVVLALCIPISSTYLFGLFQENAGTNSQPSLRIGTFVEVCWILYYVHCVYVCEFVSSMYVYECAGLLCVTSLFT